MTAIMKLKFSKIRNSLFFISLIILFLRAYLKLYSFNSLILDKSLFYTSIALLITGFLLNSYNFKNITITLLVFVYYLFSNDGIPLLLWMLIVNSKEVSSAEIVRFYLKWNLIFLIVTFICGFMGIMPEAEVLHYRRVGDEIVQRKDWGFGNPNGISIFLIPIITSYIYLKFKSWKLSDYFILASINMVMYLMTYSRTSFLSNFIILIIIFLFKMRIKKDTVILRRTFGRLYGASLIYLTIISWLIGAKLNTNNLLNKMLSRRPSYWGYYLNNFNINLFGNNFSNDLLIRHPLDNAYLGILMNNGIIIYSIMMFLFYCRISKAYIENKVEIIVVAIYLIIYGMFENMLLALHLNFLLIILARGIENSDEGETDDSQENTLYLGRKESETGPS